MDDAASASAPASASAFSSSWMGSRSRTIMAVSSLEASCWSTSARAMVRSSASRTFLRSTRRRRASSSSRSLASIARSAAAVSSATRSTSRPPRARRRRERARTPSSSSRSAEAFSSRICWARLEPELAPSASSRAKTRVHAPRCARTTRRIRFGRAPATGTPDGARTPDGIVPSARQRNATAGDDIMKKQNRCLVPSSPPAWSAPRLRTKAARRGTVGLDDRLRRSSRVSKL